jgi:hypothetical protein
MSQGPFDRAKPHALLALLSPELRQIGAHGPQQGQDDAVAHATASTRRIGTTSAVGVGETSDATCACQHRIAANASSS